MRCHLEKSAGTTIQNVGKSRKVSERNARAIYGANGGAHLVDLASSKEGGLILNRPISFEHLGHETRLLRANACHPRLGELTWSH